MLDIIKKDDFIKRYSKMILQNKVAVFLGAGTNIEVGLPTWIDLLKDIFEDLNLEVKENIDLALIAQVYINEKGSERELLNIISEKINLQNKKPEKNLTSLTRLPIQQFWTTNYADLLEKALNSENKKYDSIYNRKQFYTACRKYSIFKIHGDILNKEYLVLSKDSYDLYEKDRKFFWDKLSMELINKNFLFIGTSMEDTNLNLVLSKVNMIVNKEDKSEHFIFLKNIKEHQKFERMFLQHTIIALIVPLKSASNEHLAILSKVAQKLAKPDFQELLLKSNDKSAVIAGLAIDEKDAKPETMKPESPTSKNGKKKIVAITACPVGVAHTYIAQDKLELAAKTLGHDIKVETHGSIGIKCTLTKEDITSADLVIIAIAAGAADLGLERFAGKPLYQLEITKVIKDPEGSMNKAFAEAKPFETKGGDSKNSSSDAAGDIFATDKKGIMKHIMAGVGYMVPFVVFGGIMIALSIGLTKAIYGPSADPGTLESNFLYFMFKAGVAGFTLMIPILAGYIAYSIAGRAALVPAMVSAFIANTVGLVYPIAGLESNVSSGFLGALLIGPVAGYLVKWMISWKVPKTIAPIMPIFVIPIIATFLISFTFIYAIGVPIAWLMQQLQDGLTKLPTAAMAGIRLLLGAMVGFDMGGPINKIAFLTASGLVASGQGDPNTQIFMGAVAAAIPVAPIGMGLTTMIFRKYFNEGEKTLGLTALLMGCIGISEGAIPFAVRDPKRAIISNIVSSAAADVLLEHSFNRWWCS